MSHSTKTIALFVLLGGCAQIERMAQPAPDAAPVAAPVAVPAAMPAPDGADPSPAAVQRPAPGDLGLTVASLGSAREPGTWLKTPLVTVPGRGRVSDPRGGTSVEVDLIPRDGPRGSGSQLSVAGFQTLGVPLTGLPELRVTWLGE